MLKAFNFKSDFFKNVLVLTSGTVLAQMVAYLLIPIITRLYTPDDMAEMALFIRIIGVGSALATFRYELALPIITANNHSFHLYKFAVRVTIITSVLSALGIIIPFLFFKDLSQFLFYALIPAGIAFSAFMYLGTNWALRFKQFRLITITKMVNSVGANGTKVLFGFLQWGYIGLLLGTVIGVLLSSLLFFKDFFTSSKKYGVRWKSKKSFAIAKQFNEFPKVNLPHTLLDMLRDLLVASILWELYGQTEYGYYSHTYQMLRLPLILVGSSISQVFFQRCAEKLNKGIPIQDVAFASIRLLILLSIVPFTIIFFFGEDIFSFVFGQRWKESGIYAEIMAVWLMMNFVLSPLSILPLLLKKQRQFLYWNFLGLLMMVLALVIPSVYYSATIYQTLWIVSVSQAAYFVALIFFMLSLSKRALNQNAYNQ
ncbi:MAG: oligosaccharide flippase family protein [Bacteroidota bacterium]